MIVRGRRRAEAERERRRRRRSIPAAQRRAGAAGALERLLLFTALGTAVASFIYEIAWIRMLALVLGSATHSFELMLSAFILGLALGALWIRCRADRVSDPVRTPGPGAVGAWALLALATLPLYVASFGWIAVAALHLRPHRRRATPASPPPATRCASSSCFRPPSAPG